MHQITLFHTGPPYASGTVVQTTHADFLLHDTVGLSWPLNPNVSGMINVVLLQKKERYLAHWITDGPPLLNQHIYTVVVQLPKVWRPLG